MKSVSFLLIALAASAPAAHRAPARVPRVIACASVPQDRAGAQIRFGAHAAADFFSAIGVALDWRPAAPCPTIPFAIQVDFSYRTPETDHPGALAYAFPNEGTRIVVLYDRVQAVADNRGVQPNRFVAAVLAHEIGHILRGDSSHSAIGIMQARWGLREDFLIRTGSLAFAPNDVAVIRFGIASREAKQIPAPLDAAR